MADLMVVKKSEEKKTFVPFDVSEKVVAYAELRGAYGRKGKVGESSKSPTSSVTANTSGWRGGFTRSGVASAQIKTSATGIGVDAATTDRDDLRNIASVEKWFKSHGVENLDDIAYEYKNGMHILTYTPENWFSDAMSVVSHTSGMEGIHKGWGMDYDKFKKTYGFQPEKYPDLFKVSKSGSTVFPTAKHAKIRKSFDSRSSANANSVGTKTR